MRKLLREPLLHFLFIGAALFVIFDLVNERMTGNADTQIIVSAGRIEQLENIFTKTWQRPPTTQELKGLIDDFILEEIYYRQAVAMGIDRDDTVIRRRLRQKFEFLTDDLAGTAVPSDEDLASYLAANPEAFMRDTTYTFEQVYISSVHPDVDMESYVGSQLSALRDGKKVEGSSGLLPAFFDTTPSRVVDANFGAGFSASLNLLPLGEWQGPIESGLGLHLVRIESRVEGVLPDLAEIRPLVGREWAHQKRIDTRQMINEQLLKDYEVVIEWPAEETAEFAESE